MKCPEYKNMQNKYTKMVNLRKDDNFKYYKVPEHNVVLVWFGKK